MGFGGPAISFASVISAKDATSSVLHARTAQAMSMIRMKQREHGAVQVAVID